MAFPINVAVFASGAGSNCLKIIGHFKTSDVIKIALVVCNKPGAGVIDIARENDVPVLLVEREKFFSGDAYLEYLEDCKVDFIVLAGFLWKIPALLINRYPCKIINIHPALLPAYGGKNMYGARVHEAVIASGDRKSGITIHYVDELYDNGDTIFQKACDVDKNDTPQSLADKIHTLEHAYYPVIIEQVIKKQFSIPD